MKNIGEGVDSFRILANNLNDGKRKLRDIMTCNFQLVEDDAIS